MTAVTFILAGCNKQNNTDETVPIPTFAPYEIPSGQPYSQKYDNFLEEKTQYGQTQFFCVNNSTAERIKSGRPQMGVTNIFTM